MSERKVRFMRLIVTLIIGAPVAVLVVWPQAFGAQAMLFFSQLIAFRAVLALLLGLGGLLSAAVALKQRSWATAAGLAIVLLIASAGNGWVLIARGTGSPLASGDLTVVAWNTQGGAASPQSIARLATETDADIVSLPETDELAAAAVVRLLASEGRRMTAATTYGQTGYSPMPTSVLIADHLGEYRLDSSAGSTPGLPSAVWHSVDGRGPTIVAAHPHPPLPWSMDRWREGLRWVADQCNTSDVIVAGDLNATMDHLSGLGIGADGDGRCRDAASSAGAGAVGTWPASAPTWLATPIDRVLVGEAWIVRGAQILSSFDGEGSDHRPIVARIDAR